MQLPGRLSAPGGPYGTKAYINWPTLSNDATDAVNDIGIAAGEAAAADGVVMVLASSLIKRLDATWAVGTNQGMRASGAAIADTTYHIFLIRRPDTGVVDVAADTSATGANIAANTNAAYTQKRRIGSILRESAALVVFHQRGNHFLRKQVVDYNTTVSTTAILAALSVPLGIKVIADLSGYINHASASRLFLMSSPDMSDTAPAGVLFTAFVDANTGLSSTLQDEVRTDTSGQIRIRANGGATNVALTTHGWWDDLEVL